MKKVISIMVIFAVMVTMSSTSLATVNEKVKVYLDGQNQTSINAFIDLGIIYVPVKTAFSLFNAGVKWEAETKSVRILKKYTTIYIKPGSDIADIDGKNVRMAGKVITIKGNNYIPAELLSSPWG